MNKQNPIKNRSTDKPNRNKGVFKINANWTAQAELLKTKFVHLTDSDLRYEQGHEEVLLTRLAKKLNKHRREVINIIRECEEYT